MVFSKPSTPLLGSVSDLVSSRTTTDTDNSNGGRNLISNSENDHLHNNKNNEHKNNNNDNEIHSGAATAPQTNPNKDEQPQNEDLANNNNVTMAEATTGTEDGAAAEAAAAPAAAPAGAEAAAAPPAEAAESASTEKAEANDGTNGEAAAPSAAAGDGDGEGGDKGDVEMKDAAPGTAGGAGTMEVTFDSSDDEAAEEVGEDQKALEEKAEDAADDNTGGANGASASASAGEEKSEKEAGGPAAMDVDDEAKTEEPAAAATEGGAEAESKAATDESKAEGTSNGSKDEPMEDAQQPQDASDKATATTDGGDGESKEKPAGGEAGNGSAAAAPAADTVTPAADAPAADAPAAAAAAPPPPLLKGTLSYNAEKRTHQLKGMWNYENSNAFPAQAFHLSRTLGPDEDVTELPKDGEFNGAFSLAYIHTTSKGKQKERSKSIMESGVKIKFIAKDGFGKDYDVDGTGTNQFGVFSIIGTATKSEHAGDLEYHVELRKRYVQTEPSPPPAPGAVAKAGAGSAKKAKKGGANGDAASDAGPPPPPSEIFPTNVVCLRGKLGSVAGDGLLGENTVHRVSGLWASGLNLLESDPGNTTGFCNKFEYEHRAMVGTTAFPISGKYAGWFYVTGENGERTQIMERDVTLKFRKNSEGYYNVDGRGSNVYGKYTISGTLDSDNILTIFRHFKPIKIKAKTNKAKAPTPAPGPLKSAMASAKPAEPDGPPPLTLDEVVIPGGKKPPAETPVLTPPDHGTYSVISRGVLRVNEDGAHTCSGKWAITREHYGNNQTNNFHFGLEAHSAQEAAEEMKKLSGDTTDDMEADNTPISPAAAPASLGTSTFPIDSANYKGSFKVKRGSKTQSVIDRQIVLKFVKNSVGSYNVYGVGINTIGKFNILGTIIMTPNAMSGHIELYRIYIPIPGAQLASKARAPKPKPIPKPVGSLVRRESSRAVKPLSHLDHDDPEAQRLRVMNKCREILKFLQDKDKQAGAIFAEPVDPVALNIPTYTQIVTDPMDLGTIQSKMDEGDISSCKEFARLVRLVFENAVKFNVDASNPVHIGAKNMLSVFNHKFKDVELMDDARPPTKAEIKEQKRLEKEAREAEREAKRMEKKRKKSAAAVAASEAKPKKAKPVAPAAAMATANVSAMSQLMAAVPADQGDVTRTEFNLLIQMIQQMQGQMVAMQKQLDSGAGAATKASARPSVAAPLPSPVAAPDPVADPEWEPEYAFEPVAKKQKKSKTKKAKSAPPPVLVEEPLTFEEQEELTEAINNVTEDMLAGIIQIIRESATIGEDEDEIDLEIDALDTTTQRKLQRFVMKNVKKKKKKGRKPKAAAAPAPAPAAPKPSSKGKSTKPKSSSNATDSFFSFGDDQDSDSDDDAGAAGNAVAPTGFGGKTFSLGDDHAMEEDDDGADLGVGANWNISKTSASASKADDGDDDAWGAARKQAEASKALEADRKARDAKMMAEAEAAQKQSLAAAAARGEEIRALQAEREMEEARRKEEEVLAAEAAREEARQAAREAAENVEQTVDLDAQRDIMRKYEQNFLDNELGGSASPSSDFGF